MKIIITIIILISGFNLQAQSNVRLLDVGATPIFNESNSEGRNIDYSIFFKINHPENASQLVLKIGTGQELSDIKEITADITHNGDIHAVNYNGQDFTIHQTDASFIINLTLQEISITNVYTLYVIDDQGIETLHHYFNN